MARTTEDRKEEWERKHVQHVLDSHNKKYGVHIEIKDKTTNIYPNLKGELNWDWVCYDTETGEEIAVEVKRVTDPELEEKSHIMWQLLREVQSDCSKSKQLPGTFTLAIDIPQSYYLPFDRKRNRQKFKDILCNAILRAAKTLKLGETKDLIPQVAKRSPLVSTNLLVLDLHKLSDEGNFLYKSSGTTGWDSIHFDKTQLEEFEQLVLHANEQLKKSSRKETFLVLIEEGYRPKDPDEIAEAFTKINAGSYSKIRHVYFIRGKEITKIPLPTPSSP